MLTAKDLMTQDIMTIPPHMPIADAIDELVRSRVSGLPVTDQEGHLLGIITEFALLAIVYDNAVGGDPVSQHMTREVISVSENSPVSQIADLFILHRIRRVPVVNNGILVGQISRRDVLRVARESQDALTTIAPFSTRAAASR